MPKNSYELHCCLCLRQNVKLEYKLGEQYLCIGCAENIAIAYQQEIISKIQDSENGLKSPKTPTISNNINKFENNIASNPKNPILANPREIKTFTDNYVIGQEEAKKTLAVGIYQHYVRILQNRTHLSAEFDDTTIEKSNILLIGPTGVGKTLLVQTVARLLNVPFAIADATVFTEAGYVGEDVESILTRLLQTCNYNVELAQKGIVYIDEIDKLARRGDNPSITKDVGGEGVQQGLLKLLEGTEALVPPQGGRKHPEQALIKVNTKDILFICGGAFAGIEKIIAKRMNTNTIGFKKNTQINKQQLLQVNTEDLRAFGMIPELLGRLPIVAQLQPLNLSTLQSILIKPKNSIIKQYQKIFALNGIRLKFQPKALNEIAKIAFSLQTGARGLRSIVEQVLKDLIYNIGEEKRSEITISTDFVKKQTQKINIKKAL